MSQSSRVEPNSPISLRTNIRPGDLGAVVKFHGEIYAREYGFDATFEAYVAGPLAEFVKHGSQRDRLWIAEDNEELFGCIAIVGASDQEAQLRWFLVHPKQRGRGLGKQLIHEAIRFSRNSGYRSIFLWTVSSLTAAARLYQSTGFQRVEEVSAHLWGADVVEEKYVLEL